jgi:hypothetical protein
MTHQTNNHQHIVTTSPYIINPTQDEVSIHRSVPTTATNGVWSAQTQPTYDLDLSQILSSKLNRGYDFNRVLTSDVIADVMLTPLDLKQDSILSPVGEWLREYYPPPLASLKQEVVVKEEIMSVVTVMTRMERNETIQNSDEKNTISKRRHSCPKCDRMFTRRFNMITHMKTHDTTRYKCSL